MRRSCNRFQAPVLAPALAALVGLAAACGGGDGVTPDPRAPEITVTGVSDGEVYEGPVTIGVTIDVGTYSATLNGQDLFAGSTVSTPGSYLLRIEAQNGTATSSLEVSFEIRFGGPGVMILRMFDLGENENGGGGDALLLTDSTSAGQRHVLFDAGPRGPGGADLDFVADRLTELGVDTLEALILSHAHTDHFDGMGDVLDQVHVRRFYFNGQVRNFFRYQNLLAQALADADERITVAGTVDFQLGTAAGTGIRILPPLPDYLDDPDATSDQINNGSLGTRVTRGAFSLFVTGDGEVEANQRWRTQFSDETRDLTALKVGHHGANDAVFDNGSSGSSAWLAHTNAPLQLVTSNGTSHPRVRALAALLGQTAETYCTPVHGDIEMRVNAAGDAWVVSVERGAGMVCVPGRDATT
jgi:beta-lactamase superfamily II metal-dependent hydrolase